MSFIAPGYRIIVFPPEDGPASCCQQLCSAEPSRQLPHRIGTFLLLSPQPFLQPLAPFPLHALLFSLAIDLTAALLLRFVRFRSSKLHLSLRFQDLSCFRLFGILPT